MYQTGSVVVRGGEVTGANNGAIIIPSTAAAREARDPDRTRLRIQEGCHPKTIASRVHSDAMKNGHDTVGADLYLWGHWWACAPCWNAIIESGIENVYLLEGSERLFNKAHHGNVIGRQFADVE